MFSFQKFKTTLFESVKEIANKTSKIYEAKCSEENAKCSIKSYNECQGTDVKECLYQYKRSPPGCLEGGVSLCKSSGVRFPYNVNPDKLKNQHKLFVCGSWQIDSVFKQIKQKFETSISRQYIGTFFGYFRAYPGHEQPNSYSICLKDYDPRIRPWYVSATTGSKNVVIVVDVSKSMEGARFSMVKLLATGILNTLGIDDFVGIIAFSGSAKILNSDEQLVRATPSNLAILVDKINGAITSELTNYEQAFNKTGQLLRNSIEHEVGMRCSKPTNLVLFFTDGSPTIGNSTSQSLINQINNFNGQFDIKLFTYAVGNGFNTSLLRKLSCQYKGALVNIADSDRDSDIMAKIKIYYEYTQRGVKITDPVWSSPFRDAVTNQTLVAVSMPIYYKQNGVQKVLGAAAIAVPLTTLAQYGISTEQAAIQKLMSTTPCTYSNLSDCELEPLRQIKCEIPDCQVNQTSQCAFQVKSQTSILDTPPVSGNKQRYECCSITINVFIAIITSILVALVLAIVLFFGIRKVRKCRAERRKKFDQLSNKRQPAGDSQSGEPQSMSLKPSQQNQQHRQQSNYRQNQLNLCGQQSNM